MVKTGYISFIIQIDGGFDTEGNILQPTVLQTDFYDCNLMVITKEYKILVEQTWQQAKYSCYIQNALILYPYQVKDVKQVILKDNNRNLLGSFMVQNVEYLNLSKRIKLVV